VVEGRGKGHGVGLCQLGAAWMARQGHSFQEILAFYYPNTVVAGASD
jgi:SpoIID/LytB domain protein